MILESKILHTLCMTSPSESDKNKSFRHTGISQHAVIKFYFIHMICLITLSYIKLTELSKESS